MNKKQIAKALGADRIIELSKRKRSGPLDWASLPEEVRQAKKKDWLPVPEELRRRPNKKQLQKSLKKISRVLDNCADHCWPKANEADA